MEDLIDRFNAFLQKNIDGLNESIAGANALVPWFDLPLFLKDLVRALCIYFVIKNSFLMSGFVILYLVLSANSDAETTPVARASNPKKKITLSMVYEFATSFTVNFLFVVLFYFIPPPSLVLLVFVRTWLDSYIDTEKFLDERLLLEKIDDKRLAAVLCQMGTHLPVWLSTPDHQRVQWLNKILKQMWPHIGAYLEDEIACFIDKSDIGLTVESVDAGRNPPRISSVKVRGQREQIFIDVSLTYEGDFTGTIKWKPGVEIRAERIQVDANLEIELRDFVGHKPFVKSIVVHMEKMPTIDLRLRGMASAIEKFKPVKRIMLDKLQTSVKGQFPYTHILVPDYGDDDTDDENSEIENEEPEIPQSKGYSPWEILSSRPLPEERKHNNARKRYSEPVGYNLPKIDLPFISSYKPVFDHSESIKQDDPMISGSGSSPSSSQVNVSSSLLTSSAPSEPQNSKADVYISSPSNQSLITASSTSDFLAAKQSPDWLSSESLVSLGSESFEFLPPVNQSSSDLLVTSHPIEVSQSSPGLLVNNQPTEINQESSELLVSSQPLEFGHSIESNQPSSELLFDSEPTEPIIDLVTVSTESSINIKDQGAKQSTKIAESDQEANQSAEIPVSDQGIANLSTEQMTETYITNQRTEQMPDLAKSDLKIEQSTNIAESSQNTEDQPSGSLSLEQSDDIIPSTEKDLSHEDLWQSSASLASLDSPPSVRKSTELYEAIARDVVASRRAFLENVVSNGSEANDGYARTKETIGPHESLPGVMESKNGHGCIELTTSYLAPSTLLVVVHQVRNLPKKNGRIPNPYIKVYLQNQKLKSLADMSTDVLDGTQNPVFEKRFEFQLEHPLSQYTLKVSAKTKHKLAHQLGQVVLCFAPYRTASQVSKERSWYDLADPKKEPVMCWVGYNDPLSNQPLKTDLDIDLHNRASLHMEES